MNPSRLRLILASCALAVGCQGLIELEEGSPDPGATSSSGDVASTSTSASGTGGQGGQGGAATTSSGGSTTGSGMGAGGTGGSGGGVGGSGGSTTGGGGNGGSAGGGGGSGGAGPTCGDRVKDGLETDVDCGGPTCSGCDIGEVCVGEGDCVSGACSDVGVCERWGLGFGSQYADEGLAVAMADAGHIHFGGYFQGNQVDGSILDFGGGPPKNLSKGTGEGFLVRYHPTQQHVWSHSTGTLIAGSNPPASNDDSIYAIATGNCGGIVAVGYRSATSLLVDGADPGVPAAILPAQTSGRDILVQKWDQAGSLIWARSYYGAGTDQARAVACDAAGNIYVTGDLGGGTAAGSGSIDFGTGSVLAVGSDDVFVLKLDTNGTTLWAKVHGTDQGEAGLGVAPVTGGVAVGGYSRGALSFGGCTMNANAPVKDGFLVKLDEADGTVVWSRCFGTSPGWDAIEGLASDGANTLVATGAISGSWDLPGCGLFDSFDALGQDILVASFDANGVCHWVAKAYSTTQADDFGKSISLASDGSVMVGGTYTDKSAKFDSITIGDPVNGTVDNNGFVARHNGVQWTSAFAIASAGDEVVESVAVDLLTGNVAVVGTYSGTIGGLLPPSGGKDIFLLSYGALP
jgi:hypothetical protein